MNHDSKIKEVWVEEMDKSKFVGSRMNKTGINVVKPFVVVELVC